MSPNCATSASAAQDSTLVAYSLARHLAAFLAPLLRTLDQQLDRRLVSTFLATLIAIVQWRNRAHGLLLSELGAYILTPEQAPAGTKRLSNLLRSSRWKAKLLADWLWQQATEYSSPDRANPLRSPSSSKSSHPARLWSLRQRPRLGQMSPS